MAHPLLFLLLSAKLFAPLPPGHDVVDAYNPIFAFDCVECKR